MGKKKLIVTQFVTKMQLKILTHMFYPPMSSWNLYKIIFFLMFSHQKPGAIGDKLKKT